MRVIIFIVPKNSGLGFLNKLIGEMFPSSEIQRVRGEDVPIFVAEISKSYRAIGVTGEDLFLEYTLREKSNLCVLEKIAWDDEKALFRKPTLCLLGPNGRKDNLPKKSRVAINKKYASITEKYLSQKEYEAVYLNGGTEELFSFGGCDLVVDVVYSGESCREAGLEVYDKIIFSDIVFVGEETLLNSSELNVKRGLEK